MQQIFVGIGAQTGHVSNPLLVSTLHHLQGLSAAGSASLLPNSSQLTINGQFANDFGAIANMGWPSQNPGAVWLEQAKVAAMLPVYGVLSASSIKSSKNTDLNIISSPIQMEGSKNGTVVPTPSFTITSNSGIFPLNPAGLVGISQNSKSQQSSPLTFCHEIQTKDEPVTGSTPNSEARPSSIQSHCASELRPCSNSALSSQGSASVSVHSNSGSVEPAIFKSGPASSASSYVQTDVVSLKTDCNADAASYCISGLADVSYSGVNEPSTSGISNNTEINSEQSVTYVFSSGDQVIANEVVQDRSLDQVTPPISRNETQDFHFSAMEQASGSSHENALDTGNLDDLPWSSIDLGDIDLFNVASAADKDVMHSVLDMDPSAMQPILSGEPSTSEAVLDTAKVSTPIVSAQFNMPRFREKIKMRREKELADADKEFDRLLSLVAKKDAKPEPTTRLPPSLATLDCMLFAKPGPSDEKVSLSPVQFTPPDSPTPCSTSTVSGSTTTFFFPTALKSNTSITSNKNATDAKVQPNPLVPLVFMPNIDQKSKVNKVPVYKQRAKLFGCGEMKVEESAKNDDAYSFTDDELDVKPLPSGATLTESQLKEHKLEAEVAQKLAKINCAHPKRSSVSDQQSQQDLWKHVVPKKRHSVSVSDRTSVPSTPLLPPSSSDTRPKNKQAVESCSKSLSLSEVLRRRMQHRVSSGFLTTQFLDDKDTVAEKKGVVSKKPEVKHKSESGDCADKVSDCPPLPKLVLRIPRRSIESSSSGFGKEKKEKKKKKKKRKDRDHDWEGSEKKKHKKKHKHKQQGRDQIYEVVTLSNEKWCVNELTQKPTEAAVYSKKQRLMQWAETEENFSGCGQNDSDFGHGHFHKSSGGTNGFCDSFEWNAPQGFTQAEGTVAKGAFLVLKADVLKEMCPLWRVDSQNLLQKYVPIKCKDRIIYKSISTYSGWCNEISDGYLVVKVQFIKHSRSETVVEPEVPLADMFPAVSFEMAAVEKTVGKGSGLQKSIAKLKETPERCFNLNNPLRDHLFKYVKALLYHAVDLSFLQSIKLKNDWEYLRALNEVEVLNEEKKEKVKSHVKWTEKFTGLLHFYSSCALCDSEESGLTCQACGMKAVEKVIQLFSSEAYNHDTLESEELRCIGAGSPLPATEYLVCSYCAKSSLLYHKLHHMRYLILKQCEDQMELISSEEPSMPSDGVIEKCLNNSEWLNTVLSEVIGTWRKIDLNNY